MTESEGKLRDAVFRGELREVKSVLDGQCQIDGVDEDSRTPLQHAFIDEHADIAALLIKRGANVDHQDALGYSSLHYAVQAGNTDLVALLIQSGAVVNCTDKQGNSPLWRSVMAFAGDHSIIHALVKANADPDLENMHGVSPRALATTKGDEVF